MMKTRIAIVEDTDEIRNRFVEIMSSETDIECVGVYCTAEDFLSECNYIKPEVVFMDINLPGISGVECIEICKKSLKNSHFIVYSIFENSEVVFQAIKAGATGYLLKSTPKEKLVSSIKEILKGESPMSGSIAMKVVMAFQESPKKTDSELLSKRENEILDLLSKGFRYKDIAEQLFISIETVRTHIRNIYEKLQVKSRTEAINKTDQKNYLDTDKYLNSSVKNEDEEICYQKIKSYFEHSKPYTEEKYTITKLAKDVGFPVYVVSQTINKRFKMGYFDFVNHYRIEESIKMLKESNGKITIEGIAYQCGFCSRTSFYSAFKKETGQNPTSFIKS